MPTYSLVYYMPLPQYYVSTISMCVCLCVCICTHARACIWTCACVQLHNSTILSFVIRHIYLIHNKMLNRFLFANLSQPNNAQASFLFHGSTWFNVTRNIQTIYFLYTYVCFREIVTQLRVDTKRQISYYTIISFSGV